MIVDVGGDVEKKRRKRERKVVVEETMAKQPNNNKQADHGRGAGREVSE
jgi:hypothetical protein